MGEKLFIVHGYSDNSVSFKSLRDFFVNDLGFAKADVFHLDYASMDDDATFRDFADKLDADYTKYFKNERINIACHSTGSLVVRCWLALRRERQLQLNQKVDCPVKRLLMFAPANFGSDLASMGQSMLGKIRSTFFNSFSYKGEDFMESGKIVLQGLEPASPFQWGLSEMDLMLFDYFTEQAGPDMMCFPFVFAAGYDYADELQAKVVKARKKPGTDGTVRICGTNLNTRKCTIDFRDENKHAKVHWHEEKKFGHIPFAVFHNLNHGSIIDTKKQAFRSRTGPKPLVKKALAVNTMDDYRKAADSFNDISKKNYALAKDRYKDQYQQFFFKVRDDTDRAVEDFFIDFYVDNGKQGAACKVLFDLTEKFDDLLDIKFYKHSADPSCRALMLKVSKMAAFCKELDLKKARLLFDIEAPSPLPNVRYQKGYFVVYDGTGKTKADEGLPSFMYPNTTTLVDIVLNRVQGDKLASLKDHNLSPLNQLRGTRYKATGRGAQR